MYIRKPHKRNVMIEIDSLSLEEWYTCLKPYQKITIEQLVSKYGEERAAEEWLTARGPIQTVTFGGTQTNVTETSKYWGVDLKMNLINLFVVTQTMTKSKESF